MHSFRVLLMKEIHKIQTKRIDKCKQNACTQQSIINYILVYLRSGKFFIKEEAQVWDYNMKNGNWKYARSSMNSNCILHSTLRDSHLNICSIEPRVHFAWTTTTKKMSYFSFSKQPQQNADCKPTKKQWHEWKHIITRLHRRALENYLN